MLFTHCPFCHQKLNNSYHYYTYSCNLCQYYSDFFNKYIYCKVIFDQYELCLTSSDLYSYIRIADKTGKFIFNEKHYFPLDFTSKKALEQQLKTLLTFQ